MSRPDAYSSSVHSTHNTCALLQLQRKGIHPNNLVHRGAVRGVELELVPVRKVVRLELIRRRLPPVTLPHKRRLAARQCRREHVRLLARSRDAAAKRVRPGGNLAEVGVRPERLRARVGVHFPTRLAVAAAFRHKGVPKTLPFEERRRFVAVGKNE